MLELLAWPLFPFVGYWAAVVRGRDDVSVSWLFWLSVGVGGTGWLIDGVFGRGTWGPWFSTGLAWLAASGYIYRKGKEERTAHEESSRLAMLKDKVAVAEQEHAVLRQELQKFESEEARAFQIYGLAKSLTESLSWDSLVNRFSHVLQQVTGSADFLLYLTSAVTGELELKLKSGVWPRESLPVMAASEHPRWVPYGPATLLQVPLWQGTELLGMLWIRWTGDARPSLSEIEPVFEHLLIGFQKASLFARMDSLSRLDGLTGVLRRQNFLEHVDAEWKRARTFKTPFSLILVDVDHFKKINDKYGHPVGDTVLSRLGALLRQGVYETDSVGRYGGEEFSVLFSRADTEGVRRKAETLRANVAAEDFMAGSSKLPVTISVGLAHYPRDGHTVEQLLEAADRALYSAKHNGRNRVVDFGDI